MNKEQTKTNVNNAGNATPQVMTSSQGKQAQPAPHPVQPIVEPATASSPINVKVRFGPVLAMEPVIRRFKSGTHAKPEIDLVRALTGFRQFNATMEWL